MSNLLGQDEYAQDARLKVVRSEDEKEVEDRKDLEKYDDDAREQANAKTD